MSTDATASSSTLFWPAVWFTIEYTVLVTILLMGMGLGLALLVQEGSRWIAVSRMRSPCPATGDS